jgi:hypothetical protein
MRILISTACILGALASALPASADPPSWAPAHGRRAKDQAKDEERQVIIERDAPPRETHVVEYNTVIYRDHDGRYYCRHSDGTTGLIVGAALGGVIGNRLAPGKSATLDTLLGAGAGALIGQQLDKGSVHCE